MELTGLSQMNRFEIKFASFFWKSMDWLYPPRCCNCDRWGFVLCEECFSQIDPLRGNLCKKCGYPIPKSGTLCLDCRRASPPFTEMRSWAAYCGPLQKAIHALKYRRNLALGSILAQPLIGILQKSDWKIDVILPVPLSPVRLRQRGYNQAGLISHAVSVRLGIPCQPKLVRRVRNTETQISLDVNKRFMNLMDAFYSKPATLNDKNVLLIDDVITTGATMQSCSNALVQAGAKNVYCLSVARAILRHPKPLSI